MEFIEKQKMPEFIDPLELIKGKCFFSVNHYPGTGFQLDHKLQ